MKIVISNQTKTVWKDDPDYLDDFFKIRRFCRKAVSEAKSEQTRLNMSPDRRVKESLMHKLYIEKSIIAMTFVYLPLPCGCIDELIALAGIEDMDGVASLGKRLFVLKKYRNHGIVHDHIIKPQIEWVRQLKYKKAMITFNEYKKNIYRLIKRVKEGKAAHFQKHKFEIYKDFELKGKHHIHGCDQWVAEIKI
jgi:hypothetical protein